MWKQTTDCADVSLATFNALQGCKSTFSGDTRQLFHSPITKSIHFLSPFSPDFNPIRELFSYPIRELFSKVKTSLKSLLQHINDLETILLSSFICVTEEDCNSDCV